MPPEVVEFWFQYFIGERAVHSPSTSVGAIYGASTGMPEGDPLSVVAMVAVCWAGASANGHTGTDMMTLSITFPG